MQFIYPASHCAQRHIIRQLQQHAQQQNPASPEADETLLLSSLLAAVILMFTVYGAMRYHRDKNDRTSETKSRWRVPMLAGLQLMLTCISLQDATPALGLMGLITLSVACKLCFRRRSTV